MKPGIDYIGVITPFFCHDGRGNFLFYKRGPQSNDEIGKWDCSGGTLKFGEQPKEGMLRKLKEQYGSEALEYEQLPALSITLVIDGVQNHWLAVPFLVQIDPGEVTITHPDKVSEIAWYKFPDHPVPLHPGAEFVMQRSLPFFEKHSS